MKKIIKLMIAGIVLAIGISSHSDAQMQSKGLYLTYNDYINHKLSFAEDRATANGNRIYIHEFIGVGRVTVISNGQKLIFDKNKIFGYHDANGNDYRFDDKKAYQIIDTKGFYLYSYDRLVQQGKAPKPTRTYFFSKNGGDAIMPLTLKNVANAFPENARFRYMVEAASVYNISPDEYDNESNAYKIKELYTASLK